MTSEQAGYRTVRRMTARDRREHHRVATPLELFFDLCFVVAVGQAGRELAVSLAEGHYGVGIPGYFLAFFAIWWAWMNFTWFASAYDVDDVPYRVTTLVQIAGVLILAAGVPRAFESHDYALFVIGYAVMRLALVTQWLRAAAGCAGPERTMTLRYAAGVALCQLGWWPALLVVPDGAGRTVAALAMIVAELSVPVLAERRSQTSWHPHHISERYGLFTLIVLGETVAAATVAVQSGLDEEDALGKLAAVAIGGLLICFSAWWVYFAEPIHDHLRSNRQAFVWGYGHYLVFLGAAAIGSGLEVAVEDAAGKAHVSSTVAAATVTVPTALYLFTVWLLHSRHVKTGAAQLVLPLAAAAVLACTAAGSQAVLPAGLVCAAAVAVGLALRARRG
ncbi:low temperature requirement protein A [Kitasatospora sp. NPDC002227]|uniref:low temperature requirement protein A n=1 Tax=Kitasatospora sp. NPDC002227 TaxID=3154773 RepID=UPI00331CBFBA